VIVGVNGYDETKEVVSNFLKDEGLTHPVVLMGGAVASEKYHVRGYPTGYWLDHEGNIVDREVGFGDGNEKHMMERIDQLLAARNGKPPAEKPYKLPAKAAKTKSSDNDSEK
jgi:hypothetical protein